MKKFFFAALIAVVALKGQAQSLIVHHVVDRPYHHSYSRHHGHHRDNSDAATAALVTVGVLGAAALIGSAIDHAQEVKEQKAVEAARMMEQRNIARQSFTADLAQAENDYKNGNYVMALQTYAKCAKNNDYFQHMLGDQQKLVSRIEDCNRMLNSHTAAPSVQNNGTVNLADYGQYFADVQFPVCTAKNGYANAPRITRVSRNANEVRVEMEYVNRNYGQSSVNVASKTYIKGKKSGKLPLYRVENISVYPQATPLLYGGQTLKFALVFPALSSEDASFSLCQPSSDWKFDNIVCM